MRKKAGDEAPKKTAETRETRLKAALKQNLQRRKAQARARKASETGRGEA